MSQFPRRRFIRQGKSHAIEPRQPLARACPQIPLARLGDGVNGVLRQAVVTLPAPHPVRREGVGWRSRGGRRRDAEACQPPHQHRPPGLPAYGRSRLSEKVMPGAVHAARPQPYRRTCLPVKPKLRLPCPTGTSRHRHRSAAVLSRSSLDIAGLPRCPESPSLTHVLRLRTAALRACPDCREPWWYQHTPLPDIAPNVLFVLRIGDGWGNYSQVRSVRDS